MRKLVTKTKLCSRFIKNQPAHFYVKGARLAVAVG